jgi:HNH endonuclease
LQSGNFSEYAHVVAFSDTGPRRHAAGRLDDINEVDNLMLLCATCHKLIDDRPSDYPVEVLRSYKTVHEARIHHVTGLGPDLRTSVVQLKAKIAGSVVDIPAPHVYEAVAPRYPTDRQGHVIDLSGYRIEDREEYYRLASREVRQRTAGL